MRSHLIAVAMAAALQLTSPASSQNPLAAEGEPVTFGQSFTMPAPVLAEARTVNILLPSGYGDPEQASTRYPVLYLLDGGTGWQDFVHIASMIYQGGLWGGNTPMIVVGIESKDRRAEFTNPSSDQEEVREFPTSGQAARFRRFLTEELKPMVESAYRTNGTDGVMGESLAGLFVVDTALHDPIAFDRYIAVSPSLWRSKGALADEAATLIRRAPDRPRTLWLSMADEGGTMEAGMDKLVAALRSAAPVDFSWSYTPYPDEKHSTIYHPAATRAIRTVFPPPPPEPKP